MIVRKASRHKSSFLLFFFSQITRALRLTGKPIFLLLLGMLTALVALADVIRKTIKYLVPAAPVKHKTKKQTKKSKIHLSLHLPHIKRAITVRTISLGLVCVFVASLFWQWETTLDSLPNPRDLSTREVELSTKIYDRHGKLLYTIYKDKNRSYIPLTTIPLHTRLAFLAAEDREFYNHLGFSVKGMTRSIIKYAKEGTVTSGSTITQQLVKNALLSSEKTLSRKIREILLAVEVEQNYTKDQILEMYLNEVSFGGTAYGLEQAAHIYFGKETKNLSLAESALLAGLPKSPTKYSPFGAHPEAAEERQKEILALMQAAGFISAEEETHARAEKLNYAPNTAQIEAPHFVMYVRDLLVEKYGEEMVEKGGLEVTTTLDLAIQKMAEQAVREEVQNLSHLNVGNGAAVVLNPQTGEILAMVGSKDYFDTQNGGNVNVTVRLRQPGSSIKIVNYAYALAHGFTPATIIPDTPIQFAIPNQAPYAPHNYDGKFRGNLTLRSALAESRNIPAVRVLASYGVDKMIDQGRLMGISTWTNPARYGLSLTLGGADIKLLDLARVYATVANYGVRPELTSVLKIANQKGRLVYAKTCETQAKNRFQVLLPIAYASESAQKPCLGTPVIDKRVAFMLIDILKDNAARAPAFGTQSALVIPNHPEIAVKTGTSNSLKDNLTLGFNQDYLVAVWVGNNDSTPMARIASGITGAAPIWHSIMQQLVGTLPSREWIAPSGLVLAPACTNSGTIPCLGCSGRQEWFLEENQPKFACKTQEIGTQKNAPQESDKRI